MAQLDPIDPGFHPGQTQVAASKARFRVLVAGRRWGKTRLGVWECLKVALEGGRAWWVAPAYKPADEGWIPLKRMAQEGLQGYAKVNLADKIVTFPNGGSVQVRSQTDDPNSLRGAGLDLLVMDEAALLDPETWYEILRPALADKAGRALFISTPRGMRNWFYDLWDKAADKADWERFQYPTSANPYIPQGEIGALMQDMPSVYYRQEIEGEFMEVKGNRYDPAWWRFYQPTSKGGLRYLNPLPGPGQHDPGEVDFRECDRFCTVDLAASMRTEADFTAVASCAAWKGDLFILDLVRRRMEGPDIVPAIRDQFEKHELGVAHIEATGFQLSLVQQARQDGLPVRELRPAKDKLARSLLLEARMEAGRVWVPKDAPWWPPCEMELLAFPRGEHDDQVDVLAYAAAAMTPSRAEHDWGSAAGDDLTRVAPWRIGR
jgi:predicted phage terminase large subunit-like protein